MFYLIRHLLRVVTLREYWGELGFALVILLVIWVLQNAVPFPG